MNKYIDKENVIELIRKGRHDRVLNTLYHNYPAFKKSFVRAGGKESDSEDIFQDALLILIEKLADKGFTLHCEINTYLFSICRNLSLIYFKKKTKKLIAPIDTNNDYSDLNEVRSFIEREKKFETFDEVLRRTGKKCLKILNLFYVQKLKMTAIAEQLGFKSEDSAKTQKYKCLEKAKELFKTVKIEL